MKHLISLEDISKKEILKIIKLARKIKKRPRKYKDRLKGKILLMLFAKPSLRTRLSFEIAMLNLGGHTIFYDLINSPLGKKESIKDAIKVASNYVDVIMARLYEHKEMQELVKYSSVPVVSGLDNEEHPCQVLGDLMTIKEKFRKFKRVKMTYIGDGNNNVTHSLMYGCAKVGIDLTICCPNKREFMPREDILKKAKKFAEKSEIRVIHDAKKSVKNANVIYTDSWMSYHIPESEKDKRVKILKPYQVNKGLFGKEALFMHCLPAQRGMEVTDDVLDSERSIVYEQAYNRLPIEQAILLRLLKG